MQSAAKCPILVTFICNQFEGPDQYFQKLKNPDREYENDQLWQELFQELNSIDEAPINKPKVMLTNGLRTHESFSNRWGSEKKES